MPASSRTRTPGSPRAERPGRRRGRALRIIALLRERYPQIRLPLVHRDPFQLLVATILSAQCTDAMVNRVTPVLFERYPTPQTSAAARPRDVEKIIKPTGFFRQKTRAIINMSCSLVERFSRRVPLTMVVLLTLEGVGRKTANVILSAKRLEPWGRGEDRADGLGIVVDTHVWRVSKRLGLASTEDPEKIVGQLMGIIPRQESDSFWLRRITCWRGGCMQSRPKCPTCPMKRLCPSAPFLGNPPWT